MRSFNVLEFRHYVHCFIEYSNSRLLWSLCIEHLPCNPLISNTISQFSHPMSDWIQDMGQADHHAVDAAEQRNQKVDLQRPPHQRSVQWKNSGLRVIHPPTTSNLIPLEHVQTTIRRWSKHVLPTSKPQLDGKINAIGIDNVTKKRNVENRQPVTAGKLKCTHHWYQVFKRIPKVDLEHFYLKLQGHNLWLRRRLSLHLRPKGHFQGLCAIEMHRR